MAATMNGKGLVVKRKDGVLCITQSCFTDDQIVTEALLSNSSLKSLRLHSCHLSDKVAPALQALLTQNKTLRFLELCKSTLTDKGVARILTALSHNRTLVQLRLSKSTFTDNIVPALQGFIKENETLEMFVLSWSTLTDVGAEQILTALSTNTTLQCLSLSKSQLSDKVALPLQDFVNGNQTLRTLELWHSTFTDEGLKKILAILSENHTLEKISLPSTITDENVPGLCDFIRKNPSLRTLDDEKMLTTHPFTPVPDRARSPKELDSLQATLTSLHLEHPTDQVDTAEAEFDLRDVLLSTNTANIRASVDTAQAAQDLPHDPTPSAIKATSPDNGQPAQDLRNVPLPEALREVLNSNRADLVKDITPDRVFDYLRQWNSVTEDEEAKIKLNNTRSDQVRLLLDLISRKSLQHYINFKKALIETEHEYIADILTDSERKAGLQ